MNRRGFLRRVLALLAGAPLVAALFSACGRGGASMADGMGSEMMGDEMPGWMMSRATDAQMVRDMPVIHDLLVNHERIERTVDDIPGGIRAVTTSDDRHVAELIKTHVRQMKERLEQGDPIRHMDPVFREIFQHRANIEMDIDDLTGGVRVTETSDDPQVALLIRQHARRAVSEFVTEGMSRAMRPTPLPRDYDE